MKDDYNYDTLCAREQSNITVHSGEAAVNYCTGCKLTLEMFVTGILFCQRFISGHFEGWGGLISTGNYGMSDNVQEY